MHANSNPSTSNVKKRQLIKKKDGTFLGSPENSDPDEIILASDASIRSLAVSPVPMTVSDATFQTNMTVAAGLLLFTLSNKFVYKLCLFTFFKWLFFTLFDEKS